MALQLGTDFIDELEELRREHRKEFPFRIRETRSPEEIARAKRRHHAGGDVNHRFEGERWLNCADTTTRRKQLRKLIDEGGEKTVGGPKVSHPMLSRWESEAVGVSQEEVTRLEHEDADPELFIQRGWWINLNRSSHFAVAIGSGLMAEGENRLHSAELIQGVEETKKKYIEWGIADPDKGLLNRLEHAGIDVEHADFNEAVIRQFVTTPELKEQMRRAFILRLQNQGY